MSTPTFVTGRAAINAPARPLTLADIPQALKDQIIAEHYRQKMSDLGRRKSKRKVDLALERLTRINAARGADAKKRIEQVRRDVKAGTPLTRACLDNGVNYARAKKALGYRK